MGYSQAPIQLSNATQCSNWTYLYGQDLHPNGDIDGPGVAISFVGTGLLVASILMLNYIIAHDPEEYPFMMEADAVRGVKPPEWWKPNHIDIIFLSWIRKLGKRFPSFCHIEQPKRVEAAFNRAILVMCDIQIFSGTSVLISGFVLLPRGIQTYHWQLIVYIAWFSSITHISAMTAMRSFLHKRRVETLVRFGLMVCLLTMLIIAFIPTAFFEWSMDGGEYCSAAAASSPTVCFFDIVNGRELLARLECYETPPNLAAQAMALSLAILLFGFVSRSIKLFESLSKAFHVYFRRPISKFMQKPIVWLSGAAKANTAFGQAETSQESNRARNVYLKVLCQPCTATFLSFRITADLFGSMLAEVYWIFVLVAWGTTKLFATRSSTAALTSAGRQDLDNWTFGQMLPVLLLVAPIWSLLGAFVLSDPSEQMPHLDRGHENPLVTVSAVRSSPTSELVTSQAYSAVQNRFNSRGFGIIEENHHNDPMSTSATSGYAYCCWIGPCLCSQCGLIIALPFLQIFRNAASSSSLISFWVTDDGMIYLLLLVYPFASQFSILLGLVQEEGLLGDRNTLSHSNARRVLLWLNFLVVWGFFIILWYFFMTWTGWVLWRNTDGALAPKAPGFPHIRYGVTVAGTAVLHLAYASGYFLRVFRKTSRIG